VNPATRIALIVSIGALAISGVTWFQSHRRIEQLESSYRKLSGEVASLRAPTVDVTGAPALGADDAVVTLIEFSDYECPYCVRYFQETFPRIQSDYVQTGKIRYVFKDFPVDQLHPEAIRAHVAAHCAGEQNKFWDLHARLFSKAGTHTPELLEQRATEAGLDLAAYRACVEADRYGETIKRSVAEAVELGATGTPAFFIGMRDRETGQVRLLNAITGAQPYETFAKTLDSLLAKAAPAK
jgi:protein-disulfide isomerase